VLVVAIALVTGVALRVARLGSVPLGFGQDEACDGYDAYSILTTGRDQHGNFLPLQIEAFNDYRPPLFDYSLVPLIGAFGLKPAAVRLGAAIWGSADLAAITAVAGLTLGWPGAAVAAVLGALSPWHLCTSRYGGEYVTASTIISMAMVCFLVWLRRREDRWLLMSGMFFGLSFYSYAIARPFTPLMLGWMTLMYWPELKKARNTAVWALVTVVLLAAPLAFASLLHPLQNLGQARMVSLFNYMSVYNHSRSISANLRVFLANWASAFTPSYLLLSGDPGDHWLLLYPPGFGLLLPEQALLIALAVVAAIRGRRRKLAILLIGWTVLAAIPSALTVPQSIWSLDTHRSLPPVPWIQLRGVFTPNPPLTPSLLLAHPSARRDLLAMTPWILLSALGFVALLDWTRRNTLLCWGAAGLILAGVIFHGARFVRFYFRDYPAIAAPYFQYGMEQVVDEVRRLDNGDGPLVITSYVNQPYIYVLFFEHYPPRLFWEDVVFGAGLLPPPSSLFAPVLSFDRYMFTDVAKAYGKFDGGVFVFSGVDTPPAPPAVTIRYPDGGNAFYVVVKRRRIAHGPAGK